MLVVLALLSLSAFTQNSTPNLQLTSFLKKENPEPDMHRNPYRGIKTGIILQTVAVGIAATTMSIQNNYPPETYSENMSYIVSYMCSGMAFYIGTLSLYYGFDQLQKKDQRWSIGVTPSSASIALKF